MQNINELIGIIKGINFDGVVNKMEIVRLQSWVDKNRNLAYDKREMELIKMVDSVLDDYVIDKEEKELMLTICREFLKDAGENLSHIYELNGIIEGVVCDGEVNEAEILSLKEWMNSYGDAIREHKPSVELCKAIDDILEDGIVTEEEQAEILDLLNTRIRNAQFENKLSYLCKLVRDKKNIGPDLIDILNNESAMNEIHSRAERNLMQAVGSYSGYCANQEIIVVSLVLIAMLEYDGNYYDSVRATYKDLYARYTEQKVEGKIRSILSKYKKQSDSGSRTRIINVALENAIVPQTFLAAYFEFIFDIYKLNFEYDLPEEPYEDFEFVFEGLRNSMLSDGDEISINVTQKTYKLIAATKQLISREDGLDAVIKLSIIIVKLIDRRFWDKEIKIFNPYLKAGYEGWEKTLKESARGAYERKRSNSEIRSHWEPKILMHNNAIYLNPPAHRVKSQYDYRDIAVVVFNDGEEIYRNNNCDIREIIGGYQVNTEKIEITKPLGKLTYRLVAGSEIIYDSKDKLYRNCIVFNNEGQEINNNTDFEGTAYIVCKKGEATIDNILIKENYCIGYKLVRLGDVIEIGHDVFNFSSMAKPGIFGQLYPNCVIQKEDEDKVIPVYHDACFVVFEADNNSTKFEIDINGKPHKMGDMQYKATEKTGSTKYVVELDLQESGIYEIEVMQLVAGSKNRILQADMAYDMELTYSKNMLDDSVYRVQVSSNLLQHSIDTEINAKDFHPGFIQFDYAGKCYSYYLPFDFGFYKLSGCEWCSLSEDLWIDDINDKSVLTLYDSECDGLLLYTEGGTLAEDDIKLVDRGYYKQIPVFFLTSYKNVNRYVTLAFTANGKVKYAIPCYNKCIIDEEKTEILCFEDPKKITITPVFHGKNKVFYELFNPAGEKILTSKLLESGQNSTLTNFKSFQEYTIQFHEKTKILQLRKNTLLLEEHRTFYAKEDFIGRSFKIKYITLKKNAQFTKNWFVTCPTCRKTNIFLSMGDEAKCKYCGQNIGTGAAEYYIEPSNGFKSGETKESTRLKPKRSYAGEVMYVGGGKTDEKRLVIGNTMGVETSSDDELLVMNKSEFYMCPECGYSDIVKQGPKTPQTLKKHKNFKQYDCGNDTLEYIRLGHKFATDVARFTIPMLDSLDKVSFPQALSFLYAFLEGVSIALGIERTDIDGVLELNLDMQSYDILLYDNVPGGAGHVKRLLSKDAIVRSLKAALEKVSKECCDENTSCYNCLRNYYNQSYHNKLVRKLAMDVIKRILFEIDGVSESYQNERWHWNSQVSSSKKKMKLILGSDGRNPGTETADEIWSDLLDDCFDDDEIELITAVKESSPESISKPYYSKTVKIEETGESFTANLIWDKKQVILFLNDAYDDYLLAKKTGWNVYCTKEVFDVDELLEKVGE